MEGSQPADRHLVEDTSDHGARIKAIESTLTKTAGDIELRLREVERMAHIWKAGLVIAGVLVGLFVGGSIVVLAALAVMEKL